MRPHCERIRPVAGYPTRARQIEHIRAIPERQAQAAHECLSLSTLRNHRAPRLLMSWFLANACRCPVSIGRVLIHTAATLRMSVEAADRALPATDHRAAPRLAPLGLYRLPPTVSLVKSHVPTWHHQKAEELTVRRATHEGTHEGDSAVAAAPRWNCLRTPSHLEMNRRAESRIRIGRSISMRTESNYPTGGVAAEWSWRQILSAATSPRA